VSHVLFHGVLHNFYFFGKFLSHLKDMLGSLKAFRMFHVLSCLVSLGVLLRGRLLMNFTVDDVLSFLVRVDLGELNLNLFAFRSLVGDLEMFDGALSLRFL